MKLLAIVVVLASLSWTDLWLTSDQQGQREMNRGEFAAAADLFRDPMRKGIAWYRAGEFEKAEQQFARVTGADAEFNRGNCFVLLGKYDRAVERFDRALAARSEWEPAKINRSLALARAKQTAQKGGDMGDQKIGADKIVFDKNKGKNGGEETEDAGSSDSPGEMQAKWLRRVQTKPADFLKAKFAYQVSVADEDPSNEAAAE